MFHWNIKQCVRGLMTSVVGFSLIATTMASENSQQKDQEDALLSLIESHRFLISMDKGRPSEEGGEWLINDLLAYDYILYGESHGVADVAQMATAIYRVVAPNGFERAVIEVDPYVTPLLEAMIRTPHNEALKKHLAIADNLLSIPFYSWKEEAEFLTLVTQQSRFKSDALLGVDQIFIAASELVLKELERMANTAKEKAAVKSALDSTEEQPFYLGTVKRTELEKLVKAFAKNQNPKTIQLVNDLLLTNDIYGPFTGRGGSVLQANTHRENYMRRNMAEHFNRVREPNTPPPKLFFKFGGNHVMWGHSKTNVSSFGNMAAEYAHLHGQKATNLLVTCFSGLKSVVQTGGSAPCSSYMKLENSVLVKDMPKTGHFLINLKPLRYSPKFRHLDEQSQKLVLAFDKVILMQDAKAATLFEGTLPKF